MNPMRLEQPNKYSLNHGKGDPKIAPRHLERLAYVYVRQSSLQQINHNQESTQNQYQLVYHAQALGWPRERIIVIDEDLGKSAQHAENRSGFKKLLTELALDHVGIILVVEMSRLARSCKDWYQLVEVCGVFGALLADTDGVYDFTSYNDRLLLGLRGTMSEAELHLMKSRLWAGKMNKASRGELRNGSPPVGYILTKGNEIIFDPDEQIRSFVNTVFRKYLEIGTIHGVLRYLVDNKIKYGIHISDSEGQEIIEWREANQCLLTRMLHNPTYAGAYTFGRSRLDRKKHIPTHPYSGLKSVPMKDWYFLIKDCLPAYITWEAYERNQEHLAANANKHPFGKLCRNGGAMLVGLIKCKKCNYNMSTTYVKDSERYYYNCSTDQSLRAKPKCQFISGMALDRLVTSEVLRAIEPVNLQLSMESLKHIEEDRRELHKIWSLRIERATYEATKAERRFKAVDPENRLVALNLEKDWEKSLLELRSVEEEYQRFCQSNPKKLTDIEIAIVHKLSHNLPLLWNLETTTNKDRKEIIRQLIEVIYVNRDKRDMLDIEIIWKGGFSTYYQIPHNVASYESKHDFEELKSRISELESEGKDEAVIAEQLNSEGFRPPTAEKFTRFQITGLAQRYNLKNIRSREIRIKPLLKPDEWSLPALARELDISYSTAYRIVVKGDLAKTRRVKFYNNQWVVWADKGELNRLKTLMKQQTIQMGENNHDAGKP